MNKKKPNLKAVQGGNAKPQASFQELVSDASLAKLKPFIMELFNQYKREQTENFQGLYERLTALEKLVLEKTGTTDEQYTELVTDVQDDFYNLQKVSEESKVGDVLRIEVETRAKDQEEYQGRSRFLIQSLGSGQAIGPELEGKLIGKKTGEVVETEFGVEGSMVAKMTINRVSRRKVNE